MSEDILVISQKKNKVGFKVKKRAQASYSSSDYKNVIDVKDPKMLAQVLADLELLYNAPIKKAFKELEKKKKNPFW